MGVSWLWIAFYGQDHRLLVMTILRMFEALVLIIVYHLMMITLRKKPYFPGPGIS